jgi:AraC family transcriptional regulator of adaptative response / DNA-3-methyladenine glycosylase II
VPTTVEIDRVPNDEARYRAIAGRDSRFDGVLVYAVKTTGVYCRPSCPSRTPRPENVQYFTAPTAAEAAGFRPCRRCLPQRSIPDTADRLVRSATELIATGLVDEVGVAGLAGRLAVSQRHLNRLLHAHLGASAQALAHARRAQAARLLLQQTDMEIGAVAYAAGFGSIRQFNDVLRATFGQTPTSIRSGTDSEREGSGRTRLRLRLRATQPYDFDALLSWYRSRAVPRLEQVDANGFSRQMSTPTGLVLVRAQAATDSWIVNLELPDPTALGFVVGRLRAWLDLDADVQQIALGLAADGEIAAMVRRRPGVRVPVWPDAWEGVLRTVLGQQVSVAAAASLLDRLIGSYGAVAEPGGERAATAYRLPSPATLADAEIPYLPRRRAQTVRQLAGLVAVGVDPGTADGLDELGAVPGVGPWTRQYWRLRVLGDPDAWPESDLVLRRAVGDRDADRWRPWRAYAAQHIWTNAPKRAKGARVEEA